MNVAEPSDRRSTVPESFSARVLDGLDDGFLAKTFSNASNVFQSDALLREIKEHVLTGSQRFVLVGVTDSAGNAVALFPFVWRRKFGIAILEAVDFGLVDYFAPSYFRDAPLTAQDTKKLWSAVLKAAPTAHAVTFKKLPRLLHHKLHALSGADFLKPMGADATTVYMCSPDRPPVDPDMMSLAKEVRRKSKKLEKLGGLTFSEATTNAEVEVAMATLVEFRTARFAELGRHDAMIDPRVVAFYRAMADRQAGPPAGRLFTLRAGGRPVAVIYAFFQGDVFTLIAPAISPCKETQAGSPGLVALFKSLQWCREQGFAVFDLSVGSLSYKSRFEAETTDLFEHQQALTPFGLIIVAEAALRRRVRHLSLKHPQLRLTLEKIGQMRWRREQNANA